MLSKVTIFLAFLAIFCAIQTSSGATTQQPRRPIRDFAQERLCAVNPAFCKNRNQGAEQSEREAEENVAGEDDEVEEVNEENAELEARNEEEEDEDNENEAEENSIANADENSADEIAARARRQHIRVSAGGNVRRGGRRRGGRCKKGKKCGGKKRRIGRKGRGGRKNRRGGRKGGRRGGKRRKIIKSKLLTKRRRRNHN